MQNLKYDSKGVEAMSQVFNILDRLKLVLKSDLRRNLLEEYSVHTILRQI